MNEKFVKVEVLVDTTNPEQLGALGAFLSTVGGVTVPIPVKKSDGATADFIPPQVDFIPPQPESEKPAEPEAPKPARKRSPKPVAPAEPEKPAEPEIPAAPAEPEKSAEPEKEYKVEEVREKLKEKVSEHREEIKAKLTELGAPNVSSLDPSKYTEFVNFLEGLE